MGYLLAAHAHTHANNGTRFGWRRRSKKGSCLVGNGRKLLYIGTFAPCGVLNRLADFLHLTARFWRFNTTTELSALMADWFGEADERLLDLGGRKCWKQNYLGYFRLVLQV